MQKCFLDKTLNGQQKQLNYCPFPSYSANSLSNKCASFQVWLY